MFILAWHFTEQTGGFFFRMDKNQKKNMKPFSAGNNSYHDGEFCECTSKNAIKSTQFHEKLQ